MKAYKCDICGKLYEKDDKIENRRIELTLRIASVARAKMDLWSECYDNMTKHIGMENKAYFSQPLACGYFEEDADDSE